MILSNHVTQERADRYAFIASTIGLGTVIHSHKQEWGKDNREPYTVNITSTGVAMVMSADGVLVTLYILSIQEAKKYFINTTMPMLLEAIIKRNTKRRLHIVQNEKKF
jgi:hypothetical protein